MVLWVWVVFAISDNRYKRKYEDVYDEYGRPKENDKLLVNVDNQDESR